jgi:hypothetical protein
MSSIKKLMAIDKEVSGAIVDNREIGLLEAENIVSKICKELNLSEMTINFCFYEKKADWYLRKLCRFFNKEKLCDLYEEKIGKRRLSIGEAYHEINHIVLYSYGQNISTLLHEIAHLLPNGANHGKNWIKNFKEVVEIYNKEISICACHQADMVQESTG